MKLLCCVAVILALACFAAAGPEDISVSCSYYTKSGCSGSATSVDYSVDDGCTQFEGTSLYFQLQSCTKSVLCSDSSCKNNCLTFKYASGSSCSSAGTYSMKCTCSPASTLSVSMLSAVLLAVVALAVF